MVRQTDAGLRKKDTFFVPIERETNVISGADIQGSCGKRRRKKPLEISRRRYKNINKMNLIERAFDHVGWT
jgi:hypothetical protein